MLAAAQSVAGDVDAGIATRHKAVDLTETLRSARAAARLTDVAEAANA